MENKAHAIIAVSFLVVFSIAAILVYYWLTHGAPTTRQYEIVTGQSVGGLKVKSDVQFKGLVVGSVQSIHFDKHNPAKVDVLIGVEPDVLIAKSTYATLDLAGLTGGRTLALHLGKGSRAPLKTSHDHPAHIPLHKGLLARIKKFAGKDLKKINKVIANAQKVLSDKNRKHLAATIRQLDTATQKVVTMENNLMPVVKQLPAIAESAHKTLAQSHALLARANALAKAAKKPMKKVGQAADSLADFAATGDTLVRRMKHRTLPTIDKLSASVNAAADSVDALANELLAKPQSLIFGPPKARPGPGEPGFGADHNGD
jgi:phospholipid/cholesterol/gamma-HCH transport system substrate-binding protein